MAAIHGPAAFGGQMAQYFRLKKAESLVIPSSRKSPIAITRLKSRDGLAERSAAIPPEKAFVVSMHLTPASERGCEIWVDDKHSRIPAWPSGGAGVYDLESNPRVRNAGDVDWVHYHIPRFTLDAFTDDAKRPRIPHLQCAHGTLDPILHHMTQLILPSLQDANRFSEIFLDCFRLMLCAHVATNYGHMLEVEESYKGGLAHWQKKRVEDMFRQNLEGNLRLAALAGECGLSISHFSRSFRRTFGTSPHRYLILQRIAKAKELLKVTDLSLLEVGLESGFSDQAAFSRTFKAVAGASPGRWQREITHRRSFVEKLNSFSD